MDASLHLNLPLTFRQLFEVIRQLPLQEKQRLLAMLLKDAVKKEDEENLILTHFASESVLGKDWLAQIEDEAWQNL